MGDYPPIPPGTPLGYVAQERLDEAIDFFLKRYRISGLKRPGAEYRLKAPEQGWYESSTKEVIVTAQSLGDRAFFAEEGAGHWLYLSVSPDKAITSVNGRNPHADGWLAIRNLQELMGRYAANIFTGGRPAKEHEDLGYEGFDEAHRWGYEWADRIWREHGDAYFTEFLYSGLDETVALLDELGFDWDEIGGGNKK